MAKTSAAQMAAAARWEAANVDVLRIKPYKRDKLRDRLQQAIASGRAKSMNEYMVAAIKAQLEKDGF